MRVRYIKFFVIMTLASINILFCTKSPTGIDPKINNENTMQDIDNNVYRTVKIGNQIWMAENLRTTRFNDGTPIKFDTSWKNDTDPAYCYFTNSKDFIKKNGALYNWSAASSAKIAPTGWHVPTHIDINTLIDYLVVNGYNWDGTKDASEDNKIAKSLASKSDWDVDSTPGAPGNNLVENNKSGFNAYPSGWRAWNGDKDDTTGTFTGWWCSTDITDGPYGDARYYSIAWNAENLFLWENMKTTGYSIRLIKD